MNAAFERYIGIDYSGAETCESSLKGLRVYMADCATEPREVAPPPSPRWYWSRKEIAQRLVERLMEPPATLMGVDHGFSFPLRYFAKYGLPHDWSAFLDDFQKHWPTDEKNTYVDFVREGECGNGAARCGDSLFKRGKREKVWVARWWEDVIHAGTAARVRRSMVIGTVAELARAASQCMLFQSGFVF